MIITRQNKIRRLKNWIWPILFGVKVTQKTSERAFDSWKKWRSKRMSQQQFWCVITFDSIADVLSHQLLNMAFVSVVLFFGRIPWEWWSINETVHGVKRENLYGRYKLSFCYCIKCFIEDTEENAYQLIIVLVSKSLIPTYSFSVLFNVATSSTTVLLSYFTV